jgi:hypothetical protein
MALPPSSLATACRSIVDFVDDQIAEGQNPVRMLIGSPADAVPQQGDTDHRVNFFFYRVEPAGDTMSLAPDQPWLVRVHCLITAFAVAEDQTSAGENDLRLLGSILRVFHETPILPPVQIGGEAVRPRVVFQPLSLDELNHVWSTQGDVHLRPSACYEMALLPVVPDELGIGGPLVGAVGFETRAVSVARTAGFGGSAAAPPVQRHEVDTTGDDWRPRICLVVGGLCAESLSFEVGSAELAGFVPAVWVAGRVGAGNQVTLRWETWDATAGWLPHAVETPADPSTDSIDPDAAATAVTVPLALPFDDQPGQLLLYAVRSYTPAGEAAPREVRSNPILLSLFGGGA